MKRALFFLLSILFFSSVAAQNSAIPRHLDPRVVAINKELPRSDVVSHDSRDEAIRGAYGSSKYLQPLTEWTKTETPEAVIYRTRYKIPFEWIDREQFLYLGRVSASFDVAVNGTPAGYSQTGSTPSEFDITRISKEGANELEITVYKDPVAWRLENSRPPVPPRIEGEVHILSQPRMRVRDISVNTRMEGMEGLLELGVILKSHQLNAREYAVYYELLSPRGEIVASGHKDATLDMRREDTVRFFQKIPDVTPWSHEQPRLYTLCIKTRHEGRFKEHLAFQVGFRSIDLLDGMIHLNGTPLRFTMRDFTPTSDMAAMRTAIELLRAEGVDALRLRGAPPSREFYALCDETGIYLSGRADIDTRLSGDSRKVGGNPSNDPAWEGAYLDRVMSMYHTSKNSPSVVMFSLAGDAANGYNLYESYLALKGVEHHRPVLYTGGGEWNSDRLDTDAMEGVDYGTAEQWASVTADDVAGGRFRVRNTRRFTPLTGEAVYRIVVGRKTVFRGSVPLRLMPRSEVSLTVPVTGVKAGKEYTIRIEICTDSPGNKYILGEGDTGERPVFRAAGTPLDALGRTVITHADFPSGLVTTK